MCTVLPCHTKPTRPLASFGKPLTPNKRLTNVNLFSPPLIFPNQMLTSLYLWIWFFFHSITFLESAHQLERNYPLKAWSQHLLINISNLKGSFISKSWHTAAPNAVWSEEIQSQSTNLLWIVMASNDDSNRKPKSFPGTSPTTKPCATKWGQLHWLDDTIVSYNKPCL